MKFLSIYCLPKIGLVFSALAFTPLLVTANPSPPTATVNVEQLIKERVNRAYNVGIVVAVISPDGTHFYNYGKSSKQSNAWPVNENSLFPLASITKVFTGLLFADMVEQGKLGLDDPAQKYLPQTIRLPTYKGREITLIQLATHTSGLSPRPVPPESAIGEDPYGHLTTQDLENFLNHYSLTRAPGTQYEYGDLGFGLLADIVSNQAGISYPSLISERITKPLAMDHTQIITSPNINQKLITGYNAADQQTPFFHFPILQGAGALYSTASDLTKFVSANLGLNKSHLYSAMKLSHIPRQTEGNPAMNMDFPGVENLSIGIGWNIDGQHQVIWKNGNMPGFSSFIGFNPVKKIGVVILTNTGNVIYTTNLGIHLLNPKLKLFRLYQEKIINPKRLEQYSGQYQASDGSLYTIVTENRHLKVQHINHGIASNFFYIYSMSETQFFGKVANAIFTFQSDKKTNGFVLNENGSKTLAKKIH